MTGTLARLQVALAGRYVVERELGAGGMATVYLAEDVKHHRQVAVKVLNPELAAALGAERFQREIEIAARLHHPHILPLHDSGTAGLGDGGTEFLYYVMPLVEGESLRDRLSREKQLPIEDALRIAREVADALSYAHSHGVIHRDIKPENILLESGHAMVADFGIAKAISAAGGQTLTGTGMAIGTPAYMSPEQAAGEKDLDGRTDLYSLGCVLYEMLAGQPPFTGPTTESIVRQHMVAEPPSITSIRPAVPASVAAAIQRALSKTPADRFNPVALFAEALGNADAQTHRRTGAQSRRTALPPYRLTAVIVAVAAIAWLGWRALRPSDSAIDPVNTRQVTREPPLEIQVAISPDGREVAYTSGYPGHTHIEVRSVTGGRPLSLTGDWQGFQLRPRWNPDGQSIRFNNYPGAATDHGRGVWTMPRMGGQAVAGRQTLEIRGDSAFARSADGSATLLFTGTRQVHSAEWSNDHSRLAFVRGNADWVSNGWGNIAPSSIWVVTVGSAPVRVTSDSSLNVSPVWLPDGRLLFVSNRDGPRDVYVVRPGDRAGQPIRPPVRLTNGLEPFSVSVSADGRTLAYDRFLFRRNIYSLAIPRAGTVSIREAQPLTALNQTMEAVEISRDGKWLVFDSNLDGNQDIYVMPAEGGEPRRVTHDPGGDFSPDFSPDGREIVFLSTRNATRDIYIVNADGTGEQRLTSDSGESYHPAFSPDGLQIAYYNPEGTSANTYILRRDSIGSAWGAPELLVRHGGHLRWSPDNRRMTYEGDSNDDVLHLVLPGGVTRALLTGQTDGVHQLHTAVWSADNRTIYFSARSPTGVGQYEISATGGTPRLLVRFDPAMDVRLFRGVAVGNGRFYFTIGELESDIYVMDLVYR